MINILSKKRFIIFLILMSGFSIFSTSVKAVDKNKNQSNRIPAQLDNDIFQSDCYNKFSELNKTKAYVNLQSKQLTSTQMTCLAEKQKFEKNLRQFCDKNLKEFSVDFQDYQKYEAIYNEAVKKLEESPKNSILKRNVADALLEFNALGSRALMMDFFREINESLYDCAIGN